MKTISNREINVYPNIRNRTFTIRVEGAKYRTIKMNQEEFESCLHNTGNDWQQFLKSSDYYKV